MRWIFVLVTSNIPKQEKKRNQLAFLPYAQCYIEKLSWAGLAFFTFFVRKIKNASETTHSVIRPYDSRQFR